MDEGVVAHVREVQGLSCEVGNPITELATMSHDEADLIAVQRVT